MARESRLPTRRWQCAGQQHKRWQWRRPDHRSSNDVLNGGNGNDTFVFAPGFGNDAVSGFDANPAGGQDLLEFGAGITAGAVTVTDVGADTLVTVSDVDSILLVGIKNAASVTIDDFRFVA